MNLSGEGTLICKSDLHQAMDMELRYTFEKFRYMGILSGCDYLASIPGIGIKRAHHAIKWTQQDDLTLVGVLLRIVYHIYLDKNISLIFPIAFNKYLKQVCTMMTSALVKICVHYVYNWLNCRNPIADIASLDM